MIRSALFITILFISLIISAGVNFINYNLMVINKALTSMTSKLETVSVSLVSLNKEVNKNDIKNPPSFEFGHYIIFDYNEYFSENLPIGFDAHITLEILPENFRRIHVVFS